MIALTVSTRRGAVAEKVRLSAIDLPKVPPVRALPLLSPRHRGFYGVAQLLPGSEVTTTRVPAQFRVQRYPAMPYSVTCRTRGR